MTKQTDVLVIGSGIAGLTFALKASQFSKVIILAKEKVNNNNSFNAQGGVASVYDKSDSFEKHIDDTLNAGAGLCHQDIVKLVIEQGPERINELINWGVHFDKVNDQFDLTREGGHKQRRILHVQDHTGKSIFETLYKKCLENPNIEILENMMAIDLITSKKLSPFSVEPNSCLGCYGLNTKTGIVTTFQAKATVLSTGGMGKVYLYTTNWEGATGDGIAMAYRAGARVSNLEFMQFHPTCLYDPKGSNFLISEVLRGEGAKLVNSEGKLIGDENLSLQPRDIVARAIDYEIKKSGKECVYLDISHKGKDFILSHFPVIFDRCWEIGIDISKDPIPVVPAAHYQCGGILVNQEGLTDISKLYAIGENACTGLHGANRLASNSLLECLAFAHLASESMKQNWDKFILEKEQIPQWVYYGNQDQDEMAVITHIWDEIRRIMWNYVGIVRSDKRLRRAQKRLTHLREEIKEYYWNFKLHRDVLELRNIALVAQLSVDCALLRKESRGIHFNLDHTNQLPNIFKDTVI